MKVDYALNRWQTLGLPNWVHVSAREQHGPSNPRWQESYSYSDGSGHEVMKKVQASVAEIARRSRVAEGTIYLYSATKRELLQKVVARCGLLSR